MASFREYRRRSLLPLSLVALAAYYFFLFLPLSRRAESLDDPLQKAWLKLAASLDQPNAPTLDFLQITNQLRETRQELEQLESAKKKTAVLLELPATLRARVNAPFQLVDYQNERSKQIDELDRAAKQQKVVIDPAVFVGFPEHTADVQEPALLWPALALTDDLLLTAIACKVSAIHSLEVPLALTNAPTAETAGRWAEIPVQIEFTAPADSAVKFVQTLPLRTEELRAAGLTNAIVDKAPMFIDRLIIKKQSPEKLDEVRVSLQAVGFVLRE
jgi:hypothetical protein